jgi:hypothetical protein
MAALRCLHDIGRDSKLWCICALLGLLAICTSATLAWSRSWLSCRASGKLYDIENAISATCKSHKLESKYGS